MRKKLIENVYYNFSSKITILAVTNTAGERRRFLLDSEDIPKVRLFWWRLAKRKNGRIYLSSGNWDTGATYLHRMLLDASDGIQVDHRNRNTLDNRKWNLRIATPGNNQSNQGISSANNTGAVGVFLDKKKGRYIAQVRSNKKTVHVGSFSSMDDAIRARDNAAKNSYGEFAFMNKPEAADTIIWFT